MSPLVSGAVGASWLAVAVDTANRDDWDGISRLGHVAAALGLYTTTGTLLSLAVAAVAAGHDALVRRLGDRRPPWQRRVAPALGALIATAAGSTTAFWVFSGERVRGTPLHTWGPWLVLAGLAASGAIFGGCARSIRSLVDDGRHAATMLVAAVLLALAAVLVRVDLTVFVSLYSRLHTALEVVASLLVFVAFASVIRAAWNRGPGFRRVASRFALGCALWSALYVLVEPLRSHVGEALRHAWREPVYVGRMLSRAQIVEGFVRDPRGWRGATMSSVVLLRERYDIATTTRSPVWDQPLAEPPDVLARVRALRGERELNVIFFYVDTLRADIARDPRVMPNTVRLAGQAIDFRRAYTTGSDTLHALPGLVGGTYDLFSEQPNDLVHVARAAGYDSTLVVAQSAREFLARLLPQFRLEHTIEVPDYAAGNENVWGYGADQPTAARITDRAIDWLREHGRDRRFFLWMFHFDVHNWRELDEAYVRQVGKQNHLLDESDPVWRYKIVARSVDLQLQRVLDALDELSLLDETVFVFLSDHGEGLGREGFWVHSVYLWEDLVHVPLLVRVPGTPPAVVRDVVSLVDVAPTVARFFSRDAETRGYQGEDLLTYLSPDRPPRRLPLLLMGTLKEVPVRIGLVDPSSRWKLVLPLEGAVPELYDLRSGDPDSSDVGPDNEKEMLRLLNELVRAPLFPRVGEAGSGPLDQAAREGRTAIALEAARNPPPAPSASAQ